MFILSGHWTGQRVQGLEVMEGIMKNIITMFCIILVSYLAHAGELNFETTAEGITERLTKPKTSPKIRTRSLKIKDGGIKTRSITVVGEEGGTIVQKTITVDEGKPVQGVNLKIEFDVNSYTIRRDSYTLLDELGKALTGKKLRGRKITIKGHTDSDGQDAYNLKLSLNRGLSVKQYLTSNFPVSAAQLKVIGYGEAMPLVLNTGAGNKQINRRVEIACDD